MSYQIAYTTHFRSLDNTLWDIDIYIDNYAARPLEICLEGDEPCVIEWQETGKMDVVQSSTCTLRVSNESDRQMMQLMNHPNAAVLVRRNGMWYWFGLLDDSIYEEPYSFKKAYVTEIIFSDFGSLNRIPFTLTGKQSVWAIVRDCLYPIFGDIGFNLYTSLLEPKTLQPITLNMLYINADRFKSDSESWDKMKSKREVLEEILRPLGLRIIQKNAQPYIYDIEYLRDHDNFHNYPVWKGTDAYLKGSETFGWFEVAFEPDADEMLADGEIDYDFFPWCEDEIYFVGCYDESVFPTRLNMGYYIQAGSYIGPVRPVDISPNAKFFRTRPILTDGANTGVGWRIKCMTIDHYQGSVPILAERNLVRGNVAGSIAETETVLSIETGYLPIVPDRDKYQLRVNLDFILSFRPNPFDNPPDEWVTQQNWYIGFEKEWREMNRFAIMVPVKLEVLNDAGTAIYHYKNADSEDIHVPETIAIYLGKVSPLGIGNGYWVSGAASSYGDMFLAYYKDYKYDDEDRDPLVTKGGWTTNRIALAKKTQIASTLYRVRADGEYLPLPPVAGRLRLTVGNGVFLFDFKLSWHVSFLLSGFTQQMYRNPKITLVKDKRRDDEINTDTQYERDMINLYADHLDETVKAGCWSKGIAPSARGLLFNSSGVVWEKFIKNGSARTLQEHRLKCIEDQTFFTQPVISGTAELSTGFCAYREWNTPGIFLVTALRQDLHEDLEKVTMARIANVGGFVYEFSWSDPFCAEEEEPYSYEWSSPVCAKEPGPYKFSWSKGVCIMQYIYTLEWEEMQTYD